MWEGRVRLLPSLMIYDACVHPNLVTGIAVNGVNNIIFMLMSYPQNCRIATELYKAEEGEKGTGIYR